MQDRVATEQEMTDRRHFTAAADSFGAFVARVRVWSHATPNTQIGDDNYARSCKDA